MRKQLQATIELNYFSIKVLNRFYSPPCKAGRKFSSLGEQRRCHSGLHCQNEWQMSGWEEEENNLQSFPRSSWSQRAELSFKELQSCILFPQRFTGQALVTQAHVRGNPTLAPGSAGHGARACQCAFVCIQSTLTSVPKESCYSQMV